MAFVILAHSYTLLITLINIIQLEYSDTNDETRLDPGKPVAD